MNKSGFWGGIEPKTPWKNNAPQLANSGKPTTIHPLRVVVPMQQHIGAPCQPHVKVGDSVKVGQRIGNSDAFVSVPVHASVSGTVSAVEERQLPNGRGVTAVEIENNGLYQLDDSIKPPPPLDELAPADIVEIARQAGLVGMGGATFPLCVKLSVKEDQKVDTLLLNGSECEPMLAADDVVMQTQGELILKGAKAAAKAVGAGRIIIGIEANKPVAIDVMDDACRKESSITVHPLATRYPQGGEKQLIQAVTGREVPIGKLPLDVGVVVSNVSTMAALGHALTTGEPLTSRVCTVTGDVNTPQNVRFPIGTLASDVISFCGGFNGAPARVVAGGPMMGLTLTTLATPLAKGNNGLVIFNTAQPLPPQEDPCIRCNRCVSACPMRLMPLFIDRAYRQGDDARTAQLQAQSCINCGCCSYVCPAKRRLAENITRAKGDLDKKAREAKNA